MNTTQTFFIQYPTVDIFYNVCKANYSIVNGGFSWQINDKTFVLSFDKKKYTKVFDFPVEDHRLAAFCQYFYNRMLFLNKVETMTLEHKNDIKKLFLGTNDFWLNCTFEKITHIPIFGLSIILIKNVNNDLLPIATDHHKEKNGEYNYYIFDDTFRYPYKPIETYKDIVDKCKNNIIPSIVR